MSFIRYIGYPRSRNNELRDVLQFELTSASFFGTKEGYLCKPVKSDLVLELKNMIKEKTPEELAEALDKRMAIFDMKGFVRQVPVKKSKLKSFSDLCNHLWTSFQGSTEDCECIDIVATRSL